MKFALHQFKKFKKKLNYLSKEQIEKIQKTYEFANEVHIGQKRVSGEEFITHPLEVACILADMHMDIDSIIASLLHDVLEDTPTAKEIIINKFGKTIAELVDGVTKLSKMEFSTLVEAQAESFRKMIFAMSQDIRVILIKLADRLHNMRTINSLPKYKRKRIAKETLDIYAPIAIRLGIHNIYIELESLSFAAYYPLRSRSIEKATKKARGNRKEIMSAIEKDIKKTFAKSPIKTIEVIGREKHIYSIYKKMLRKHISFSEIMDLYGFRVILKNKDECYRALGIIHSLYKPFPGKFKDYIAIPKINGYQSLHTTLFGPQGVPIEIQIRTQEMEQMASIGIAAHWLYKTDEDIDVSHVRAQQWVNDLLEMQRKTGNSLEFIENVKTDLFTSEIYVFTPKGEIIELPHGSTAVDFAYSVHTDIGNSCASAKVNYKFAPLSTVLSSGQTVSITIAPNSKPNPAWLNFIKTGRARSAIKHFLKNQKQEELIALGKKLLDKSLSDYSITLDKISKKTINNLLMEANLKTENDLYEEIGLGKRTSILVAQQLIGSIKLKKLKPSPILIQGAENIAVKFASCCYPLPGDNVVGFLIPEQGLIIHTENCKNTSKLRKFPEKCIWVKWADDAKGIFTTLINVEMSSKKGSFGILATNVGNMDGDIDDIIINQRTGTDYVLTLRIFVRNKGHLNKIIKQIKSLPTVTKANRIK